MERVNMDLSESFTHKSRREKKWRQVTEKVSLFILCFSRCKWADRQTDRHAHRNISHNSTV